MFELVKQHSFSPMHMSRLCGKEKTKPLMVLHLVFFCRFFETIWKAVVDF